MPYIEKSERDELNKLDKIADLEVLGLSCQTPGQLNYVFTKIAYGYLMKNGLIKYARINDIIGAFECAKLEFYRKKVSPYEEIKEKENGSL